MLMKLFSSSKKINDYEKILLSLALAFYILSIFIEYNVLTLSLSRILFDNSEFIEKTITQTHYLLINIYKYMALT